MKTKYYIIISILPLITLLYFIDRTYWMKQRILRHNLWVCGVYNGIRGDAIATSEIEKIDGNLLFFNHEGIKDTLILKYQYFNNMKLMDPKTKQESTYRMKGANWMDYTFFGRKGREYSL